MSKTERAEQRREERKEGNLEKQNYTYNQVQSLVVQRDRIVHKMYDGLRAEIEKLGYESKYTDGVWTLEKIPELDGLSSELTIMDEGNIKEEE